MKFLRHEKDSHNRDVVVVQTGRFFKRERKFVATGMIGATWDANKYWTWIGADDGTIVGDYLMLQLNAWNRERYL